MIPPPGEERFPKGQERARHCDSAPRRVAQTRRAPGRHGREPDSHPAGVRARATSPSSHAGRECFPFPLPRGTDGLHDPAGLLAQGSSSGERLPAAAPQWHPGSPSSPLTAAGPPRICTGFPRSARRGSHDRTTICCGDEYRGLPDVRQARCSEAPTDQAIWWGTRGPLVSANGRGPTPVDPCRRGALG